MQAETGQVHVLAVTGSIKSREGIAELACVFCQDASGIILLVETLQSSMP